MARADVDLAIEWAAAEGWNPGLNDAACFRAADPDGFLLGCVDGEPVATISAVRYGATFGFIGLYIVKPGWRGRGYGMQVWNAALARLAGRTIGLDGVVAQQANYRKSGFALAYRNMRYAGTNPGAGPIDARIVPLSSRPFTEVAAYDRAFFADDRTPFLRAWLAQPQSKAYAVVRARRSRGLRRDPPRARRASRSARCSRTIRNSRMRSIALCRRTCLQAPRFVSTFRKAMSRPSRSPRGTRWRSRSRLRACTPAAHLRFHCGACSA